MKIQNQDVEVKLREVRRVATLMLATAKKARKATGRPLPREQLKTGITWALHNGAVLTLGVFGRTALKPEPSVREGVQTGVRFHPGGVRADLRTRLPILGQGPGYAV